MNILYVGQLWSGGTCLERMGTLGRMGNHMIPFDTTPWTSSGPWLSSLIAHRANVGPKVWGLNAALIEFSRRLGPVDLVWIDKGRWVTAKTLFELKQVARAPLLHYTPDAQFHSNQSRHFTGSVRLYDCVVTTKLFELPAYTKFGAKRVLAVLQGYDPRFGNYNRSETVDPKWSSEVCFVGHHNEHYAARLNIVSNVTKGLRIWGPGWGTYARRSDWAYSCVRGNGVWGEDYLRALSSTKIALGLLQKSIPETTTTRSFEIPAIGTFLLAERTEDHRALFDEGVEAEFFDSDEELEEKISFYLRNDLARQTIAAAGRARCIRSGYSSEHQLKHVLEAAGIAQPAP